MVGVAVGVGVGVVVAAVVGVVVDLLMRPPTNWREVARELEARVYVPVRVRKGVTPATDRYVDRKRSARWWIKRAAKSEGGNF